MTPIQKGTRYCEPHLALSFAQHRGHDQPTDDDRADAHRIFESQVPSGALKVAKGDGTLEWVKPEKL